MIKNRFRMRPYLIEEENPIEVCPNIVEKILLVIRENNLHVDHQLLRLGVQEGTELDYVLGLETKSDGIKHLYDNFFDLGEIDMVVSDNDLEFLKGSKLFYKNNEFVIDNPNSRG